MEVKMIILLYDLLSLTYTYQYTFTSVEYGILLQA